MGLISNIGSAIKTGAQKVATAVKNVVTPKKTPATTTTTPSTSTSSNTNTTTTKPATTSTGTNVFTQKPYTPTSTTTTKSTGSSSSGKSSSGSSSSGTQQTAGDLLRDMRTAVNEGRAITVDYNAGTVNIAKSTPKPTGPSQGMSSKDLPGTGTGYYTSGGTWVDTGAQFGITTQTGVAAPKTATSIFTEPYYSTSGSTRQTTPITQKPAVITTTGLPSPAMYGQSRYWDFDENVTTPRLSGLGVPSTPRLPGDTSVPSEQAPGTIMTNLGGFSTAFPDRYTKGGNVSDIFGGKVYGFDLPVKSTTPPKVELPTKSFSGRIDPKVGIAQVERIYDETQPLIDRYTKITTEDLSPVNTKIVTDLGSELDKFGNRLEFEGRDIARDEEILGQRYKNVDTNNPQAVEDYNMDVASHRARIDRYNADVKEYGYEWDLAKPVFDRYSEKVNEVTSLVNDINTRKTMAADITSNIELSSVPEAIPTYTGPERYGPGGIYEYPSLRDINKKYGKGAPGDERWERFKMSIPGTAERTFAAGRGIFLAGEKAINPFPKDKKWGEVMNFVWSPLIPSLDTTQTELGKANRGTVVNPAAIKNPFVRDLMQAGVDNPLLAAGVLATAVYSPALAKILTYGIVVPTVVAETSRAALQSGKLGLGNIPNEKLYNDRYTFDMDVEGRQVLLGSIPEATGMLEKGWGLMTGKETGEWVPLTKLREGINLGLMPQSRLQMGVDALYDYYKLQGLSDQEALYRVSKVQDSIKINNQAEFLELISAGVGTNIAGGYGTKWAQGVVQPAISKYLPALTGAAATKTAWVGSRVLGMAPAGALEGVYFTGAQKGGRYDLPMTGADYVKGAGIGAITAPAAQMFIELPFTKLPTGAVLRPKMTVTRPTWREGGLFAVDPLEPISDVFTDVTVPKVGISSIPITGSWSEGYTFTSPYVNPVTELPNTYKFTPGFSTSFMDTFVSPYTSTATEVAPYVSSKDLVLTDTKDITRQSKAITDVLPMAYNENVKNLPMLMPETSPLVQPEVYPLVNTNVNPLVYPNVNTNVEPYVYPNTNPFPDVITANKFPPWTGWMGSLGESELGATTGKRYKEWLIGNKIATYGEDWMAKQQMKAANLQAAIKGQQPLRMVGQGVAVVNRIIPRQQIRMPQMSQQQFRMPQMTQPQIYNTIPRMNEYNVVHKSELTPRQKAQIAVERGFGQIKPLTNDKIKGNRKYLKPTIHKSKGWM